MIRSLFRISVSVGLLGMAFGIFMGIRQEFALAPAHAHLNLLGFVTMFLSALYYRVHPIAAESCLARCQAVVSAVGAILFRAGIAGVLLGGHDRFEPLVVGGALIIFAGMVLFGVIVYRTAGSGRSVGHSEPGRVISSGYLTNWCSLMNIDIRQ